MRAGTFAGPCRGYRAELALPPRTSCSPAAEVDEPTRPSPSSGRPEATGRPRLGEPVSAHGRAVSRSRPRSSPWRRRSEPEPAEAEVVPLSPSPSLSRGRAAVAEPEPKLALVAEPELEVEVAAVAEPEPEVEAGKPSTSQSSFRCRRSAPKRNPSPSCPWRPPPVIEPWPILRSRRSTLPSRRRAAAIDPHRCRRWPCSRRRRIRTVGCPASRLAALFGRGRKPAQSRPCHAAPSRAWPPAGASPHPTSPSGRRMRPSISRPPQSAARPHGAPAVPPRTRAMQPRSRSLRPGSGRATNARCRSPRARASAAAAALPSSPEPAQPRAHSLEPPPQPDPRNRRPGPLAIAPDARPGRSVEQHLEDEVQPDQRREHGRDHAERGEPLDQQRCQQAEQRGQQADGDPRDHGRNARGAKRWPGDRHDLVDHQADRRSPATQRQDGATSRKTSRPGTRPPTKRPDHRVLASTAPNTRPTSARTPITPRTRCWMIPRPPEPGNSSAVAPSSAP